MKEKEGQSWSGYKEEDCFPLDLTKSGGGVGNSYIASDDQGDLHF